MKKAFLLLALIVTISACGSKTGSSQSNSTDTARSGGGGGAGNTPAKSNLDTTNDSTHTPAHVDSAGKKM